MDERLQQALDFANYKQTLTNQLHILKLKADGSLIYAESGGKFTINQQLICFVDYLVRAGQVQAILLDDNKLPINIANISTFLEKITKRYTEVTADYYAESQNLKKARSVKALLGIK